MFKKVLFSHSYIVVFFVTMLASAQNQQPPVAHKHIAKVDKNIDLTGIKTPKNIILLIGDGMGLSELTAAYFYGDTTPSFDRFNTVGLVKTSASNFLVTDSAASATAYATGTLTYNGAIGMGMQLNALKTIVELVTPKNISTGLVATSSIMHATPASFYAHTESRRNYEEIATFLPTSNIDFLAGGGKKYMQNRTIDKRDIFQELRDNGYSVHTEMLPKTLSNKKQAIILEDDAMPRMLDGRGNFLPHATALAIEKLKQNKNGFFLMVEGSQIDWGGHDNDAEYLITELLDFDRTVSLALDFAEKNKETLVIVTADHETGGFTLAANGSDYNDITPTFSTKGHSASMVPLLAKGPGESLFSGIYQNTAVFHKIMALFNNIKK